VGMVSDRLSKLSGFRFRSDVSLASINILY